MRAYKFILDLLRTGDTVKEVKPEKEKILCCPFCGKELYTGEPKRLQSLDEHVSNPNGEPNFKRTYYCHEPNCHGQYQIWSEDGSSYMSDEMIELIKSAENDMSDEIELQSIRQDMRNYNTSALNSDERQQNLNDYVSNKKYKDKIYFSPLLFFNKRRMFMKINYIGKKSGEITDMKFSFTLLKKDKGAKFFNIYCSWFFPYLFYLIKSNKKDRKKKNYDKEKTLERYEKREEIVYKFASFFIKHF